MNNLRMNRLVLLLSIIGLLLPMLLAAQDTDADFYFGVDLSYVNEMEDCGAIYHENGEPRDPFVLFADHGATLVRARLWHNPDWTDYSTLDDVKRTFSQASEAGLSTLLDIHYSDEWADPGTQRIPEAWSTMNDDELAAAVYQYTYDVLTELQADDLVPAFIQIGNETNGGILRRNSDQDWTRDARLFNAGIQAVRNFNAAMDTDTKILLHVAQPENTGWWFTQAENAGIIDFDVIGISYYPQWSTFSIADMGAQVSYLREHFGKEVMVLETAYPWTRDAVDESADNILDQGIRGYPFSPEGQVNFMTDLTQSLISNGGLGVVYWEPAWVSTQCYTRWGQGSHWENATFFDFQNNNEVLEGINFLNHDYWHPSQLVDGVVDAEYGEPLVEDDTSDVLDGNESFDLTALYMQGDENSLALALTIAGDVYEERGNYLVYFDTTGNEQGADIDVGRRSITVADPFKPEFRLDISIDEDRDTIGGRYVLNAWRDGAWEEVTFTGGAAIRAGQPSVIELQILLAALGNPELVNVGIVSSGRGRVRTAGDILGTDFFPSDWDEALVLDAFVPILQP